MTTGPFNLGPKSRANLFGVLPLLSGIVQGAIKRSDQDFSVHEGLRTLERQKAYLASGASTTLDSLHLRQFDGWGHAVDLVPYVDGVLRWEWPLIFPIAVAMRTEAVLAGVKIRWGGVWDRSLNDLPDGVEGMADAVDAYVARRKAAGHRRVFIDGPHFEVAR